jgi:hypothetical protein
MFSLGRSGEATACILSCHQDSADLTTLQRRYHGIPFQLWVMLSEKPIDGPPIAAKQIEELWKLWQKTPIRCHLPFGKSESPLCSFETKNLVPLVLSLDSLSGNADELRECASRKHVTSSQYLRRARRLWLASFKKRSRHRLDPWVINGERKAPDDIPAKS